MANTYYNDIEKLYITYFDRPADPAGLRYWESAVETAGGSTAAVSAAFSQAAEYKATVAGRDPYHVVDALYEHLFSRPAELDGLTYWGQALVNGVVSVDQAAGAIAAGAQGNDLHVLTNKTTLATAFTTAMGTAQDLLGAQGAHALMMPFQYLDGVTDDASLTRAMAPATLESAVAQTLGLPGPYDIQRLYVAYLGRPADQASVTFWETAIETAGGSTASVEQALSATDAFQARFAGLDAAQSVTAVYRQLLDRAPTDTELNQWVSGPGNGSKAGADVVAYLAADRWNVPSKDALVVNQQVHAALDFAAALDTPAKVQAYHGGAADAIGAAYLKAVADAAAINLVDDDALPHAIDSLLALVPGAGSSGIGIVGTNGFDPALPAPAIPG